VGTGVGLYLVKMAVDLHGGGVEVESEEGKGSRFTIRLPLKSVAPMKERPRTELQPAAVADAPTLADLPHSSRSIPWPANERDEA
jgi:sensor histidine kinase regulating citrate/malate metabolism